MPVTDAGIISKMSDSCRGGREEVKSVDKITGMRQSDWGCFLLAVGQGQQRGARRRRCRVLGCFATSRKRDKG